MACILPFRNSKENSKYFLESIDAIDSEGLILDKELFNEAVDQLEKETIQAYNIQGKHWFENVLPTEPILPNEEVFEQIDNKRKQLGLYEEQVSGSLPIHFMTEEENGYPVLTALWKIKERNLVYPELVDRINDLLKVEELSAPIYLANDDAFNSALDYANYDPINNVINVRKDGFFPEKYSDQTILHEIIHAMTYNKVLNNPGHRARLELLLEITRQEIEKKYGKVNYNGKWYGLKDEHEFLAEGFSNPEFIKELMSIRHWSQSLFDDFLDWIFDTLGIKKELSVYNELYDLFVEITNLTAHPNKVLSEESKFPNMEIVFRQGEETEVLLSDEQVVYKLKVINVLQSNKVREPKLDKIEGFYNDLKNQGVPSDQIDFVKDIISSKGAITKEDIIKELLVKYSYSVEVNTATQAIRNDIGSYDRFYLNGDYYTKIDTYRKNEEKISKEEYNKAIEEYKKIEQINTINTSYYSNLTVPGGTNYSENEISIPGQLIEEKPQGVPVKEGVLELFESNPELPKIGTPEQYSEYLDNIFPKSRVKDIVYHGSLNQFESFDLNKLGQFTNAASAKEAIFFTDKIDVAETYAVPKNLNETEKGREILKQFDTSGLDSNNKEDAGFIEIFNGQIIDHEDDFDFDSVPYKKGLNEIVGWKTGTKYEYYSNVYPVLLNIKNPKIKDFEGELYKDETYYDIQVDAKNSNNDSTILKNTYDGRIRWNTIISNIYTVFDPQQIHILGSKQDIDGFKNWIKNNTITVRKKDIIPSIKGHAQFISNDNNIGWFRSDDKIIPNVNISILSEKEKEDYDRYYDGIPTKTRRILELQSDLFQKGRDKEDLVTREETLISDKSYIDSSYYESLDGKYYFYDATNFLSEERREITKEQYNNRFSIINKRKLQPQNRFLQLLNKDGQWVTFFIKSIVQDSAKKGYEKVLFPTGDTASKIEGHQTLAEFVKVKQERLSEINQIISDYTKDYEEGYVEDQNGTYEKHGNEYYFINSFPVNISKEERTVKSTKEEFESTFQELISSFVQEKKQLEQEIESAQQDFGKLRAIWRFYEETVGNILKKQYKDKINRITDEYGNQWWEIEIDRKRDLTDILFQLPSSQLSDKITPELYNLLIDFVKKINPDFRVEVLDDLLQKKGANGIAYLNEFMIQLQKGKESALSEEVCHFFFEMLPFNHPLKQSMMSDITHTKLYKELRKNPEYKKTYGNNVDLFKREAAAKLMSLYLSDKELFLEYSGSSDLVQSLIRWIKDFFKWLRGQSRAVGSFVESARQIMNLDTSSLVTNKIHEVNEMYSLGDFIKEASTLKSVGKKGLETKWYDKVYINISDTLFDISSYDFQGRKKEIMLDANLVSEREQFYSNVPLTILGKELKDKIANIGEDKVTIYTKMYLEPALVNRIKAEFGNVEIIRVDIPSFIEDESGKLVKETVVNVFEDIVKKEIEEGTKFVIVDNSQLKFNDKSLKGQINYWNYNNRKVEDYEPYEDRIKRKQQSEANVKKVQTLVEELKLIDQEKGDPVVKKIKDAFAILMGENKGITRLEERLKRMGVTEEDYISVFKNESGDLLLPISKAQQMMRLLEEMDNYEQSLVEFVGTLEAVTAFFKDRNDTNFKVIRDLINRGEESDIDNAIQELAQITKMGNHWQEYIKGFREYINDLPGTQTVAQLLSDLDGQISRTKGIAKELSKQAIGNKLDKEFQLYNQNVNAAIETFQKKLETTKDQYEKETLNKAIEERKKELVGPEDIIDILNGDRKDIDGITVWVKTLYNSGDPLVGSVSKILQKYSYEVENYVLRSGQELGEKIREIQQRLGITDKEYQDEIITTGYTWKWEGQGEDKKLVRKPRLELLNRYVNMDKRFEMQQPYLEARKKWKDAKDNHLNKEEIDLLKKDYMSKKKEFELWETQNWYREYTPEYYERYDKIKQTPEDEELFEEVLLIQTLIYNKIEDLGRESQYVTDNEGLKLINQKIEDLKKELKQHKKEVDQLGNPKSEREVKIAKMFQAKSEIDGKAHEYKSDNKKFRGEFLRFINTLSIDSTILANLTMLAQQDNYSELYNYSKEKAPYQVKQWLDLNTVKRIDPLWYEERKQITSQISQVSTQLAILQGVDISTGLEQKWNELFVLTSDLRDENNVFDGTDAVPQVQRKVKEIEEEIENLKQWAREEKQSEEEDTKEIKSLKGILRDLISKLHEIQSKDVTDSYRDEFIDLALETGFAKDFELTHSDISIDTNSDPLTIINTLEFQTFVENNPGHPFSIWYNNNHLLKTKFNSIGEETYVYEPTYIWYKIEPTDPKRIQTIPSFKYSVRKVKDKFITPKTGLTHHPLFGWLPKSEQFMSEQYRRLTTFTNPKQQGIAQILKLITDYHLETQEDTSVVEARLGFGLPYIQKQNFEGDITSLWNNFFDKRNRFEEGEANFDEEDVKSEKFKLRGMFNGFLDRAIDFISGKPKQEEESEKIMRVAVPYSKYIAPEEVSKDVLLSTIMFSATTRRADRMMKSLPLFNLIEESLQNPPTTDSKGRIKNNNTNRIGALRFAKEHWIYGVNKQYELGGQIGKTVDTALRYIRKVNTYGSLGFPFGAINVIKNNLQGRLQNLIGSQFGNWSSDKSMRKASANIKINFAYYLSQAEKPLNERGLDFQIISYFNPTLDLNIYNNLLKGSTSRVIKEKELFLFNEAMEYSIAVNLLYGHLYHQKVKNSEGETKELYDILKFKDGKLTVEEGYVDAFNGRVVDDKYLLDTKLANKTVVEYVQGKVGSKTLLSTTTIGQSLLYFKNWLIPMLRRRFDKQRPNYMIGEDLEGYWRTWARMSLIMLKDFTNVGKVYWNTFNEEEKRNYMTAIKEIAFMVTSLLILSLVFGFDADDPDKFKKLKEASYAKKLAVLLAVQAKNETEALSAMPFFNTEKSLVPTVLTEGTKWITNPTIGLSIIDNTWKTINYTWALAFNSDNAYYTKDMPQFGIEKGDPKATHYLLKVLQIDDILSLLNPDDKLRSVIGNMKR